MPREALFRNAKIYSLEREGESFAAMRVRRDGRIAELYPAGAPLPAGLAETDLGGLTVVPGFVDAHAHFMSKAALQALAVNLGRFEDGRILPDSFEGLRALLVAKAREGGGLVIGFGLCLGILAERRLPSRDELDAWLPARSVIVLSMDGHSSSYSSRALARLGFAGIAKDGILSGEAHEFNMGRVTRLVMRGLDLRALSRGISSVVAEAVAGGLVSIHCLEGSQDLARDSAVALFKLIGPSLPLRLKLWLQYTELDRAEGHLPSLERKRVGGCFAWEMDGSVSSRSAAFDLPYLDGRGSGKLYRTGEEAFALVEPFYRAGWQTSAHAIGPRAIESILSAYERVMDGGADNLNSHRLRIDHFEFPRPDQIERAGRRRLLVAAQPGFAWADARLIHSYSEALAPELLARQSPLRSLLDSGCVVALSTDAPVLPLNPFIQIAGACAHPNAAERISVHEALRAYSWAGAYAAFEEEERGSLAVGKYADFALLDRDPFETPLGALHEIGVEGSWHEGRPLVAPPPDLAGFALAALRTKRRRT